MKITKKSRYICRKCGEPIFLSKDEQNEIDEGWASEPKTCDECCIDDGWSNHPDTQQDYSDADPGL